MGKGSTQTTEQRIDPGMMAQRQRVFQQANRLGRTQFQGYGGQRIAGMDPREMAGFQEMGTINPFTQGAYQGLASNLGMATEAMRGAMGPLDIGQFRDPYQQQVIDATRRDFDVRRAGAMRDVGGGAVQAGAFGGTRHGVAEGIAIGELGRAETGELAALRSAGEQRAIQNAMAMRGQTMGTAQMMAGLGMQGLSGLEAGRMAAAQGNVMFGQTQRGIAQAGQDFNYQEFMRQVNQPFQNFGAMQSTMGAPYGTTQTQTTSGSGLGGFLGGARTIGSQFLPGGQFAKTALSTAVPQLFSGTGQNA